MTKESKLALIIGFVLVLVVGVLVSDHFSQAQQMDLDTLGEPEDTPQVPVAALAPRETRAIGSAFERPAVTPAQTRPAQTHRPVAIDNTNPRSILEDALDYVEHAAQNTTLPKAAGIRAQNGPRPMDTPVISKPQPVRPLAEPRYRYHTVEPGDTLIGIARRYLGDGDRWQEIESLNADMLGPDSLLRIGMKLRLPVDARVATQASSESRRRTTRATGGAVRTYTVKPGDTLGEIASELLGTSKRLDEIVELNGLKDADTIFVGMKLKIPAK